MHVGEKHAFLGMNALCVEVNIPAHSVLKPELKEAAKTLVVARSPTMEGVILAQGPGPIKVSVLETWLHE